MHQAKLRATQVFELAKMKGNLQQTPLFNSTELFGHSRPCIPRLAKPPFGQQTARTDRHCVSEKQPAKPDHSTVACFEHEIY